MSAEPTNVLLIFADEFRWDCLGAAGNPLIKTPNLDRLASEGVLFTEAYSTAPLCIPARAQILTGLTCWDSGVWGLSDRVPPVMDTFADHLSHAGVFTGAVGKMHFCPCNGAGSIREPYGFQQLVLSEEVLPDDQLELDDYWQYLDSHGYGYVGKYTHGKRSPRHFAEGYHAQISELPLQHFDTTWTGDQTLRMLDERAGSPFFIWCSFVKPHFPCELPRDWPCPYSPDEIPLRASYRPEQRWPDEKFSFMADLRKSYGRTDWCDEETLRKFAAYYYGNITLIDIQVGRILDRLDELGLRENTLIVFTSDHGEALGERHLFGKFTFYDESTRVPMIVAGPPVAQAGRRDSRPVILEDLTPTILQAAGLDVPARMIGQSLLPLLQEPGGEGRDAVFGVMGGSFHFEPCEAHCFIRKGRWKYMYQFEGGKEKLYDMEADPLELDDLADRAECRSVCNELNAQLACWFEENGASFLARHGRLRTRLGK